ncbi:MAG: hypothetical protein R6U22_02650 [Desulfohalobiaceae bacterium]
MILSFHPLFSGDHCLLCAGRDPDHSDIYWMQRAQAIILPQHRQEKLFWACRQHCSHVFPEYTPRYRYPGKLGQIRLFQDLNLPYPQTDIFPEVALCSQDYLQRLQYPLVIKSNYGAEGRLVFLVQDSAQAREVLQVLAGMEKSGFSGFMVQEFIPNQGRTLRVAVLGDRFYSYWRCQADDTEFRHNLEAGAVIDQVSDPWLQARGVDLVQDLCSKSGINLAGVDVLFPWGRPGQEARPLLLEINYYFARQGLGGNDVYYRLLEQAIQRWLQEIGAQGRLSRE